MFVNVYRLECPLCLTVSSQLCRRRTIASRTLTSNPNITKKQSALIHCDSLKMEKWRLGNDIVMHHNIVGTHEALSCASSSFLRHWFIDSDLKNDFLSTHEAVKIVV